MQALACPLWSLDAARLHNRSVSSGNAIDAMSQMWAFFREYPLRRQLGCSDAGRRLENFHSFAR